MIQPPDKGSSATISTDDVPERDREMNTTYTIARPSGAPQRVQVVGGVSIRQLLELTKSNFDYAEIAIQRPNGTLLSLTEDQVNDEKPAGFYTDDEGVTHFIGLTGSNRQVAAKDYFEVSGTVVLSQSRASKFEVKISPKEKTIKLGGSVSFEATVEGLNDLRGVSYSWRVDGKQLGAAKSFSHTFPKKDDYHKVSVTVGLDESDASDTDVATITVGDPERAKEEGDQEDVPPQSDYVPPVVDGGSTDPYVPVPPAPSTPPTPSPEPPDVTTSGTPVEGNLLADVSEPPPSSILESAARAARKGTPQDDANDGDVGVSEAAVSIFAALALLGLGAGIETRQGRLPRLRLPRRSA